jgi:hypothetical protein
MNYVLTFRPSTAAYRVHNVNCNRQYAKQVVLERFYSLEDAMTAAHADECEKGGKSADVKACRCCAPRNAD